MAGKPGPKSEEHKARIKASWTDERRGQVAERSKGNRFATGRKWTDAQRAARASKPSKNKGVPLSAEHRAKLALSHAGKCPRLVQYGITSEMYATAVLAGQKWCSHGKHFVEVADLSTKKGVCKSCAPASDRRHSLRSQYGVDQEWYESTLETQGGRCAVCLIGSASRGDKHMCIDHDHKTGAVRGILCNRCNAALERFDSDPDWHVRALAYLQKYS